MKNAHEFINFFVKTWKFFQSDSFCALMPTNSAIFHAKPLHGGMVKELFLIV